MKSSNASIRNFASAQKRREFLEKELDISLYKIAETSFKENDIVGRNIENLIGTIQIPLGIAGPIRIKQSTSRIKDHYIPLATTEGALVASVSRGCKTINASGVVEVFVEDVGITRGPVFKTENLNQSMNLKKWINDHFVELAKVTKQTSQHLNLTKIDCKFLGRNLFARFYFDSENAMGMNMATFATQETVNLIEKRAKVSCVAIAGNFDIDKKPAWLNFIAGRGKSVWAEAVLPKTVLEEVLKVTPEKIAELVYRKCLLGSVMSGSIGFNAHFANIVAAIFAATGQDLAHVVEGSLGITTAEVLKNGDLYFSIYLPCLIVGTVGGGTHLPTQKETLAIMETSSVLEYTKVVGAAVLAGELSLLGSLAEGSLASAHQKLGRKKI